MLNRENIGLLIELPDNAGIGAVVDTINVIFGSDDIVQGIEVYLK